jgi:hypothetical protein
MELALITGMALAGHALSGSSTTSATGGTTAAVQRRSGDNIYNANRVPLAKQQMAHAASRMSALSRRTAQTGVVPSGANRQLARRAWESMPDSGISSAPIEQLIHDRDRGDLEYDENHRDFLGTEAKLRQPLLTRSSAGKPSVSFLDQFSPAKFDNPGEVVAGNDVQNSTSAHAMMSQERGMGVDGGWSNYDRDQDMTLGVSSQQELDEFRRTQLVPYFGKNSYGPTVDRRRYEGNIQNRMELFSGASAIKPSKREVAPLFKPTRNQTNMNGMPVMTDFEQERYYVSNRRQGELPFQPIRVTPGLNLDYDDVALGGSTPSYNYRAMPKTIDQLRAANRQQQSHEFPIMQGQKGSNRGLQAPVNKNRPYRVAEQDHADLPRNGFITTAPATRENYTFNPTIRESTSTDHMGVPNFYMSLGDNAGHGVRAHVTPTEKPVFDAFNPGHAAASGAGGIRREQHQLYDNQRMDTEDTRFVGAMYQTVMGTAFNPNDTPAPTMKEMTMYDTSAYPVMTSSLRAGQAWNPHDLPRITGRQTLANQQIAAVAPIQTGGQAFNPNEVARNTLRQMTEDVQYLAPTAGGVGTMPAANWNPLDTTLKETMLHQAVGHGAGMPGTGVFAKTPIILEPTMRQMMPAHQLGAPGMASNAGYMANPQHLPNTQRQSMEAYAPGAPEQSGQQGGYHAERYHFDATMRQMHEATKQHGALAAVEAQRGGAEANPQQVPNTLRQLIENTKRIQAAEAAGQKGGYHAEQYRADPTMRQMHEGTKQLQAAMAGQAGGYQAERHHADPTMRQMYEHTSQLQAAVGSAAGGYHAERFRADPTMRQMYEQTAQIQAAVGSQAGGYHSNPQYAPNTLRQLIEASKQIGGAQIAIPSGGGDANNYEAPTTARQLALYERRGAGNSQVEMHTPYEQYYRADATDRSAPGRTAPGAMQIGYTTELTEQRLKNMPNAARVGAAAVSNPIYGNGHGEWTRMGVTTQQEATRLDPCVMTQLDSNPYNIPSHAGQSIGQVDMSRFAGFAGSGFDTSAVTQL